MSSLMGYTRWHVPHFRAVPFLTSVTGVLHFGQARISSNSGSRAMPGLYDTFDVLWNNPGMRTVVFVAMLGVSAPVGAAAGQARPSAPRRQTSPPAASANQDARTAEAYTEFLRAHMLGDAGNVDEAIAAYRRAMALGP